MITTDVAPFLTFQRQIERQQTIIAVKSACFFFCLLVFPGQQLVYTINNKPIKIHEIFDWLEKF